MHTMKPGSITVIVTAYTASGCTYTSHHPAEKGEWFLNSLLLAALPCAHQIANITRSDADPYQMRPMLDRLNEMWEDENTRIHDVEYHRMMDNGLRRIIDGEDHGDG